MFGILGGAVQGLGRRGGIPELTHVRSVAYVEWHCGHWPMFSQPAVLAELLGRITDRGPGC